MALEIPPQKAEESTGGVCKKTWSWRFRKIYRKTPAAESLSFTERYFSFTENENLFKLSHLYHFMIIAIIINVVYEKLSLLFLLPSSISPVPLI